MYEYRCIVTSVIDGDTVEVDLDLGFGVWMRGERIRFYGIDTPESRTTDNEEKIFGLLAKHFVEEHLPLGVECTLISMEFRGKFGRVLGDFKIENGTICQALVANNLAVAYHGENKSHVADAHIANRKILIEQGKVVISANLHK